MNFVDLPPMWHYDLCAYVSLVDIACLRLSCAALYRNIGGRLGRLQFGRPQYYDACIRGLREGMDEAFSRCGFTLPCLTWVPECDVLHQKMNELDQVLLEASHYTSGALLLQGQLDLKIDWEVGQMGVQYITEAEDPQNAVVRVVANPSYTKGILLDLTAITNSFGADEDLGYVSVVAKALCTSSDGRRSPIIQLIDEASKYTRFQWNAHHAFCLEGPMNRVREFVYWHRLGPLDCGQSYRPGIFNLI